VAEPLDAGVLDVAGGVHDIVNQNMAAAARMHAVERGVDLRGVTLIAFGGAGPVHACGLAELLEAPRVVFPVNASVLSAVGTLVSPVRVDLARSLVRLLAPGIEAERDPLLEEMREEARRVLPAAGVPLEAIRFRYGFDARYHGQGNEITVWVGEGASWPASAEDALARFHEGYERVYGLRIPDMAVEVVTWRVTAYVPAPELAVAAPAGAGAGGGGGAGAAPVPHGTRAVRFRRGAEAVDVPVHRRGDLAAGATITGPALVEERETTAVVRPGWRATVQDDGSLLAVRDDVRDDVPREERA
jgi:N-methylhydantoinase A